MTGKAIREALEPIIAVLNSMEESAVEFLRRTQPDDAAGMTDAEIASLVHPDESRCFTDGSQHKAKYITVGDLRRVRTAYDAIGSGVKVEPVTPDLQWGKRTPEGSWLACNNRDKLAEITAHFDGPIVPVTVEWDTNGDCKIEPALPTDTATGAGPVGEAAADEGWQPIETAPTGGKFGCFLMLAFGPQGDQTVSEGMHFQGRFYAASVFYTGGPHDTKQFTFREHEVKPTHWRHTLVAPGAARPVDEPSEVERLTRENNRLTDAAVDAEAALAESEQNAQGLASDLAGTQADLAETRERLEKVSDGNRTLPYGRDELGRFVREAWVRWAETQPNPKPSWLLAYDELPEPDKEADRQIGEAIARWTLIGDAARAALTGDAQEVGR